MAWRSNNSDQHIGCIGSALAARLTGHMDIDDLPPPSSSLSSAALFVHIMLEQVLGWCYRLTVGCCYEQASRKLLRPPHASVLLQVTTWIDAALSAGGAVLVHCHEGKSRSVALLLAYLMIDKGYTLKAAMEHIK